MLSVLWGVWSSSRKLNATCGSIHFNLYVASGRAGLVQKMIILGEGLAVCFSHPALHCSPIQGEYQSQRKTNKESSCQKIFLCWSTKFPAHDTQIQEEKLWKSPLFSSPLTTIKLVAWLGTSRKSKSYQCSLPGPHVPSLSCCFSSINWNLGGVAISKHSARICFVFPDFGWLLWQQQ